MSGPDEPKAPEERGQGDFTRQRVLFVLGAIVVMWGYLLLGSRGFEWFQTFNGKSDKVMEGLQFRWAMYGAERGNAGQQWAVGDCYEYGKGVPRNTQAAVAWYSKAANQGDTNAMSALARCYNQGIGGLAKNPVAAGRIWTQLAEGGDRFAQWRLAECYDKGDGVPYDLRKAIYWHARADDPLETRYLTGVCYELGLGVTQNVSQAVAWYAKAAEERNVQMARNSIMRLASQGNAEAQAALAKIKAAAR